MSAEPYRNGYRPTWTYPLIGEYEPLDYQLYPPDLRGRRITELDEAAIENLRLRVEEMEALIEWRETLRSWAKVAASALIYVVVLFGFLAFLFFITQGPGPGGLHP